MTLEDFRIDDDDLFANTGGTFDDEDIVAEVRFHHKTDDDVQLIDRKTPRFYPEPCFCAQYGAHLCNRHSSLLSSQVATPIVLPDQVVAHPSATANVPVQSPASVGSGRAEQHQPMWNERPGPLFVHSLPSSPSYTWQEPADAWSSAEYAQSLSVQSALPRVQSQSPGPSVSPYLHHTEQHSVFMGYNPIQAYGRPISSQGFVGGTSQMAISLPDQTYAHPWLPLHRTSMPSTYDIPRSSYQSERHPNPRDVSRLVDDLQRSSHRESTASPNDNSTGYPTPPSTGSPSTVSSSKRRSNAKMKEHDPAYPHVCESCGKRFANLGDLG